MNTTNKSVVSPRIYVASLSDYNSGRLLGRWIDAATEEDQVWAEINAMLGESKELVAEEWAIHDFEGFAGLRINEFEDISNVCAVANLIVEHGAVFAGLLEHFGGATEGLEEASTAMEEQYQGTFDSLTAFAESFIEECHGDVLAKLPDVLKYHIDYDGIARDLEMGGDVFTVEVENEVHVFWSR